VSRGREAARAANRRTEQAKAESEALRAELKAKREEHKKAVDELMTEVRRLKINQMSEASRLAAEEVQRIVAEQEEEKKRLGLSTDVAMNSLYLKDKFVYNACRYLSMTRGEPPLQALSKVMTWMTDEDFYGFEKPELIAKLGLPADGWVARYLRHYKHDLKRINRLRRRDGAPAAVSLDHAIAEGNEGIHRNFNPRWYPELDYSRVGIQLVDDEPATAG
jgi:hypothetical protein